ncbi:PTS sugar transporter subunit IIA [uncultured Anaerococcus sp.]|uniref:PTS sugar transporter subunit IIA n=1 Tax=uncultured Anaerococcus sp. TaxID=293428 RepID=UPI00288B59A1|nr:PTS sugar transporter subunit IIA [uncultured Anaerococcus sp.]
MILSRDDFLKEIIEKNNKILDKKNYFEELIKRENIASTGLENKVAIPHPLNPVINDNFLGVYLSKKGIDWNGVIVNVVLLLNISDNIKRSTVENFFKYFSDFLNDDKKISKAIKADDLEEFLNIFFDN